MPSPKKDYENKGSLDTELENEKDVIRPQNYNTVVPLLDRAHIKIEDIKKKFLNGQINSYSDIKELLRKVVVGSRGDNPPDTYDSISKTASKPGS